MQWEPCKINKIFIKAMTEITVDNGQSYSERDLYAEKILLPPMSNFASRVFCEKQNVVAALKRK